MRSSTSSFTRFFFLCLAVLLLSLTGCATVESLFDFSDDEEVDVSKTVQELAVKGMDEFNTGTYHMALEYFNKILDRYPFSPQAMLAELKAADSNYYMGKYPEALALYEEFEERHPTNGAIPYIMFQKGMCYYQVIDSIDRDITPARKAIRNFTLLLKAYPKSPYSAEAKAKIQAAKNFLVNHDFLVVKFYLRTDKKKQAIARLKYILAMNPDSLVAPRASKLLAKLEADEYDESGFSAWFNDLSLPDWMLFFKSDDKKEKQDLNQKKARLELISSRAFFYERSKRSGIPAKDTQSQPPNRLCGPVIDYGKRRPFTSSRLRNEFDPDPVTPPWP